MRYQKWCSVMEAMNFEVFTSHRYTYRRGNVILLQHVDGIIVIYGSVEDLESVRRELGEHFYVKDMGFSPSFLRVSFVAVSGGALLYQSHYLKQVLKRFGIES